MNSIGFRFHDLLGKISTAEHHLIFIRDSIWNYRVPKGFIINFIPSAIQHGSFNNSQIEVYRIWGSLNLLAAIYSQTKTVLNELNIDLEKQIYNCSNLCQVEFNRVFRDAVKFQDKRRRHLEVVRNSKLQRDLKDPKCYISINFRSYFINLFYFDFVEYFSRNPFYDGILYDDTFNSYNFYDDNCNAFLNFYPSPNINVNNKNSETVLNNFDRKRSKIVGAKKTQLNRDRKKRYKSKHKIAGRVTRTLAEVKDVGAINLSNKTVSDDMTLLLAKGPSFSPTPGHVNWKQFFLDFENFVNLLRRKEIYFQNSFKR